MWIFSDMQNDTKEFPMPELIELDAQRMIEKAKSERCLVPLRGYQVHVCGVSTAVMSPRNWVTVKEFWRRFFTTVGVKLESFSADVDCRR